MTRRIGETGKRREDMKRRNEESENRRKDKRIIFFRFTDSPIPILREGV